MKRLLKSPVFNAVCIGCFTAFYALLFMTRVGGEGRTNVYGGGSPFWRGWSDFLSNGNHIVISWILIAVTVLLVLLLTVRRRPRDEYHTFMLTCCLVAASVLTLAAIAVFFLVVLKEPVWTDGKFMLFIMIHWITVVFDNLVYVLLCRRT